MKIDIHTHTKQCKTGDAPTREISAEKFCETILATEVRIVAITNHNVFDSEQYIEIVKRMSTNAQVWPGIELDVFDAGSRGHLLVIVSPARADAFSTAVKELTQGSTSETFTTSVEQVLVKFEPLRPLYVAHHRQKKPALSDAAIEKLIAGTNDPACVIKEVTNAISAGIYISHGHASIYGSDIHDWSKYEELSRQLPDLRLPVDSFEHFCLLLKKDPTTINTALDRKTPEEFVLTPFEDGSFVKLRVYNDINVIFGPKGTGKSCILHEIAKRYTESGIDAAVYEPANGQLDEIFDVRGRKLKVDLAGHGINACVEEIKVLRSSAEANVSGLTNYVAHFTADSSNRNAKKIRLKDLEPEEVSLRKVSFEDFNDAVKHTQDFLKFIANSPAIKDELNEAERKKLTSDLSALLGRLKQREWSAFSEWKEVCLLNSAIGVFRKEVARKSGLRAKPTTTGFLSYAKNRLEIEVAATEILNSVSAAIPVVKENVGSLGTGKGELVFLTDIQFQTGVVTDGSLSVLGGAKKGIQKDFIKCVRKIRQHAYADDLFACITELNSLDDIDHISSANDLMLFKRYFALNGKPYSPSSGEASMLLLQKELSTDKEVYILDEPEKSLGNEYISEVIVPLIREHARAGKKLFISTHDANIAVRTLPYSSVYRSHDATGYKTYIGNPFSNNLVNPADETDRLDWKKVSMKTLEGGEEAFGERGKIYGNNPR